MSLGYTLHLQVNGNWHELTSRPERRLLDVLREDLGLTAAKNGCGEGACGACTVLLDGEPVAACMVFARAVHGRHVVTAEGLALTGTGRRLHAALTRTNALQCGFCAPGMVVALHALLEREPAPTAAAVRAAIAGNVCRCTGYQKIVEAVAASVPRTGDEATGGTGSTEAMEVIGCSIPRLGSAAKLAGAARFTGDLRVPQMLHGAVLLSPLAHARIRRIDTGRAAAFAGVHAVVCGRDLPDVRIGFPFVRDQYILARDRVRHVGEPVAAVAARDRATAERALELIEVEYEALPVVLDPEAAMRSSSPLLHAAFADYTRVVPPVSGHNVCAHTCIEEGDVGAAWSECDVVVEETYRTPAQSHVYLEPCTALAEFDADGRVEIWSSTQSVFRAQASVALALGLPHTRVRVRAPRIGGAFGGKGEATIEPIAAALAQASGRPVRLALARDQDMGMMRSRHGARIHMKTGARADGTLVAREVDLLLDGGAYADASPGVTAFAVMMARGPYRIPHIRSEGRAVYTNKLRGSAMRGFGNMQMSFAGERQLDLIAERLGMDPLQLRLQNAMTEGDRVLGGHRPAVFSLTECLHRVCEASDWSHRRQRQQTRAGKRRGIGVAGLMHVSALLSAGAEVRLNEDGTVMVNTAAGDVGGGADTVLAQICRGVLQLEANQVMCTGVDTDMSPFNHGAHASRTTHMVGASVRAAAEQVRAAIFEHAAAMLECAVEDLELRRAGRVGVRGVTAAEVTFADVAARSIFASGGPISGGHDWCYGNPLDRNRARVDGFVFEAIGGYGFGAQVAEVEVDDATGEVRVLEVWSAHDVGRAIHPAACEGQIQGAFTMGMGLALHEALAFDAAGNLINGNLTEYAVPRATRMPAAIHPLLIENPEPGAPFGARGIGEPALVGAAPAIASALAHATGWQATELPLTPERVRDGLAAAR